MHICILFCGAVNQYKQAAGLPQGGSAFALSTCCFIVCFLRIATWGLPHWHLSLQLLCRDEWHYGLDEHVVSAVRAEWVGGRLIYVNVTSTNSATTPDKGACWNAIWFWFHWPCLFGCLLVCLCFVGLWGYPFLQFFVHLNFGSGCLVCFFSPNWLAWPQVASTTSNSHMNVPKTIRVGLVCFWAYFCMAFETYTVCGLGFDFAIHVKSFCFIMWNACKT